MAPLQLTVIYKKTIELYCLNFKKVTNIKLLIKHLDIIINTINNFITYPVFMLC